MKRLCVYCGSNYGIAPRYREVTAHLGAVMAARGLGLIYGGGEVGLMGTIADAVLNAGGEVIGMIPQALAELELAHARLTELHITRTMHERKALMAESADGFIALPGGYGTFDELCEILTWGQLGYHMKPVGLLNIDGFYDGLLTFFDHATNQGFISPVHRASLLVSDNAEALLDIMQQYQPTYTPKWFDR